MNIEAKTVDESRVETVHLVRPTYLNGADRLFGGILMQWIDEVAGIVAKRHSMCNVTTASVDNLTFMKVVIGGPYGFSDAVYQRANSKLSLSKMTFSHQIVRAIFTEQLYRAFTILKNEPYHHE